MFFGLRPYQLEGARFVGHYPRCGLFFDCGLGKTLTTLAAMHHDREAFLPALIVAPLRVARHVWPAEIEKWGFDLDYKVIHGKDKMHDLFGPPVDVTITNPDSLQTIIDFSKKLGVFPWKTVIVDESTTFKNCQSQRWVRMAAITSVAQRTVIMTATPISGRGHLDLWAQFALLHEANPLGSWDEFCRFFTFDAFDRPGLIPHADRVINSRIAPLVLRKDVSEIPMPIYQEIDHVIDLPTNVHRRLAQVEIDENSYNPLRSIASGVEYERHWSGEVNPFWWHTKKIEAIAEIRNSSPGDNLLVFAGFTGEIDRIRDEFGAGVIDGRTSSEDEATLIQAWNEGTLPMLVMHPRSGGHGLNLQAGGHRVIWSTLPDSGELYNQAVGRIYRSGQTNHSVFVHRLIAQGTIDEAIAGLLRNKLLTEDNLLSEVKRLRAA